MTSFSSRWTARLARALPFLRPNRPPQPLLLAALQHQAPRLRTVHQVAQLRSLAACWLAAPELHLLDQHLQLRLQEMALDPLPSPRSTSSNARTAPRTTKRRR